MRSNKLWFRIVSLCILFFSSPTNAGDPRHIKLLRYPSELRHGLAFSPNGKVLASGSIKCEIVLWDVETGRKLRVIKAHSDKIHSLAFNKKGTLLASGGEDGMVYVWDVKSGKKVATLIAYTGKPAPYELPLSFLQQMFLKKEEPYIHPVNIVLFNSEGTHLAIGSDDGTVTVWDYKKNTTIRTPARHNAQVTSLVWVGNNGGIISIDTNRVAILWDNKLAIGKQIVSKLEKDSWYPHTIVINQRGNTLMLGEMDGSISVFLTPEGKRISNIKGRTDTILSIEYRERDSLIATVSKFPGSVIQLWDLEKKKALVTLSAPNDTVYAIAIDQQGTRIASSGRKGIHIWDVPLIRNPK